MLILILLLLFCPLAHADDVELGQINLTKNQINHLSSIQNSGVTGITIRGTNVIAQTSRPLTSSEQNTLKADLQALPDTPPTSVLEQTEFSTSPFRGLTAQQADDWIKTNVTDLTSAKAALQKMARVLIYLVNRSDLK